MSTAAVTSVFSARETMTRTLASIEGSTRRLDRSFGTLRGRLRSAIEFNLVSRSMDVMGRALRRVEDLLPSLIRRGEEWASTLDTIVDATGMTAEQASILAGVNQRVGGSNEALTRGLAAMAKSVYGNRDAWKEMGVQVALNNDGSVDAYRTFQNLRGAISATGGSLLSTNAAQVALSRSGKELLDLLQLSPKQWRLLSADVRRSGQVMSSAAIQAAEDWERAQSRFGSTLQGLGTQLLTGLAPVLTRFVDGFSTFIQNNMDGLVRFVVGGANTILTVIGDLLGIDLGEWSFTEQVSGAGGAADRTGKKLNILTGSHKKAASAAKDNGKEHKRLIDDLRKAERQLQGERSRTALFSRMSGVDAELWRQQKAARIKDAQERVSDAQKALAEHRRTMDRMGAQAEAAGARIRRGLAGGLSKNGGKGGGGGAPSVLGDMKGMIADATKAGHQIAAALKDGIFGKESILDLGSTGVVVRTGGLIGALQGVQKWLQDVSGFLSGLAGHLSDLNGLLGGNGPLVLGLLALAKVLPGAGLVGGAVKLTGGALATALFGSGKGGTPARGRTPGRSGGTSGRGFVAGMIGAQLLDQILREPGPIRPDEYGAGPMGYYGGMTGYDVSVVEEYIARREAEDRRRNGARTTAGPNGIFGRSARPGATSYPLGGPAGGPRDASGVYPLRGPAAYLPGQLPIFKPDPNDPLWSARPGSPVLDALDKGRIDQAQLLRRYLGTSSPLALGQEDQYGALGGIFDTTATTAGNTQSVADGTLGVQNPKFSDIGHIDSVKTKVPVDASGRTITVWTPGGRKLPTQGGGGGGSVKLPLSYQTNIKFIREYSAETRSATKQSAYQLGLAVRHLDSIRKAVGGGPISSSTRTP